MAWWLGVMVTVLLAVLRVALPFAMMALLVFGLRRLYARWQVEDSTGIGE